MPNTDGFRYGRDDVIAIAEDNDGVILINPDNPSGNFISREGVLDILDYLKSAGKYLILDESFLDFAEGGFDSSVSMPWISRYPNLIVIKSIGKSYGVGGLRKGFSELKY